MPLPKSGAPWPPPQPTRAEQQRWADLYAGRTLRLGGANQDQLDPDPDLADASSERDKDRRRVRAGVAADIAATSAALLMGDGVKLRVIDDTNENDTANADDVIQEISEQGGLQARLVEGAEIAAAYGGVFIRAAVDPNLKPVPYVTVVDPTRCDPIFVDGVLVAATIWTVLRVDGSTVWRWVENRDNRTRTIEQGPIPWDERQPGFP